MIDGQFIASGLLAALQAAVLFILNHIFKRLEEVKADIAAAKKDGIDSAHQKIAAVQAVADEAKDLAIDALDKLNEHKLQSTKEFMSTAAFEKFEERLFRELGEIKMGLHGKADK